MTARRAATTTLVALLIAAGIAACGGSRTGNGLSSKSARAIVKAATNVAEAAKSVHVAGALDQSGTTIALDLKMVAGVGAIGWMSDRGKHFSLVLDHSTLYINGGPSFWRAFGNTAVARLLRGRWLKTPATGDYATIAKFASLHAFFRQIFSETGGSVAKASTKKIDGRQTIGVRDTSKAGVLYVATSGKPYPVEIDGATNGRSGTTGRLDFTGFNAPVPISAPKHVVSVAQLQRAG